MPNTEMEYPLRFRLVDSLARKLRGFLNWWGDKANRWGAPTWEVGDPPRQVKVLWDSWPGRKQARLRDHAAEILLGVVQKDIVIHEPLGRYREPIEDGLFHIHIRSTAADHGTTEAPMVMWRHQIWTLEEGFVAPEIGDPISSPEGFIVAELVGDNNLYIFIDIGEEGEKGEQEVFLEILRKTLEILQIPLADRQQQAQERRIENRSRSRTNFMNSVTTRLGVATAAAEAKFADATALADSIFSELIVRGHEAHVMALEATHLERKLTERRERALAQYDEMVAHPQVLRVEILEDRIEVFTRGPLVATDPKTGIRHSIGTFGIAVYLNGENDCVNWFNQTQTVDGIELGMQAPNVRSDGTAWRPKDAEVFVDLIAEGEFAAAVAVAIQYIENPNTETIASEFIKNWPPERVGYGRDRQGRRRQ